MYKVIKSWPNGPSVGEIFKKTPGKTSYQSSFHPWSIHTDVVENSPEFFAPLLGMSHDGQNYFKGDKMYWADYTLCLRGGQIQEVASYPVFVSKEEAKKYIDSFRSNWKEGDWLYAEKDSSKILFRYSKIVRDIHDTSEYYQLFTNRDGLHMFCGKGEITCFTSTDAVTRATNDQILEVLSKVAENKGFVPGVTFKSATTTSKWKCTGKFAYTGEDEFGDPEDCLYQVGGGVFYENGVWAEIVEAVEEQPFVKGEWLYMSFVSGDDTSEFIGRYSHTTNKHHVFSEEYGLENGKIASFLLSCMDKSSYNWHTDHVTTKATSQKIEEILTKVAIYKGFTKGVKVKKRYANGDLTCTGEYYYSSDSDSLFGAAYLEGGPFIYRNGEWAEFKKEVKKDPIKVILSDKEIVEVKETTAMIDYAKDGEIVGFQINV